MSEKEKKAVLKVTFVLTCIDPDGRSYVDSGTVELDIPLGTLWADVLPDIVRRLKGEKQ